MCEMKPWHEDVEPAAALISGPDLNTDVLWRVLGRGNIPKTKFIAFLLELAANERGVEQAGTVNWLKSHNAVPNAPPHVYNHERERTLVVVAEGNPVLVT
jgi:hypothetical protein